MYSEQVIKLAAKLHYPHMYSYTRTTAGEHDPRGENNSGRITYLAVQAACCTDHSHYSAGAGDRSHLTGHLIQCLQLFNTGNDSLELSP